MVMKGPMTPSIGTPWDQFPLFIAATNTTVAPGGPTAYAVPRRVGTSPTDVTEFHPGQVAWSLQNLPDILYMLKPPREWHDFKRSRKPGPKRDVLGNIIYERYARAGVTPKPLLDFAILPNKIGTNEEWFVLQAIRRLDPRVSWADMTLRMELAGREKANTIQERACRTWNPAFSLVSWHAKGRFASGRNSKENAVLTRLSPVQIQNNTTRGTTPGLKDPSLGVSGGIIPLPHLRPGKDEARSRRNPLAQTVTVPAQIINPTNAMTSNHAVAYRQPSAETNSFALTHTGSVHAPEGFGYSHPLPVQQRLGGLQPSGTSESSIILNPGPTENFPTNQVCAYRPRLMGPSPGTPDYHGPWNTINFPVTSPNQGNYIDTVGPIVTGPLGQYRQGYTAAPQGVNNQSSYLQESDFDRSTYGMWGAKQ